MSEVRSVLRPGAQVGHYKIRNLVNRGKSTAVYRAESARLRQDVALKVFVPAAPPDEKQQSGYKRDLKALADLKHPNVIRIYDYGVAANLYYLTMEWVAGPSLRDTISARPTGLERSDILRIFSQIASAVATAHDHDVVHGNIKPDNVLLDPSGRPVLTDFTIPCLAAFPSAAAQTAFAAAYLSPEQVARQPLTPATDIYTLGILLYEMVTGNVPFRGETFQQIADQHLQAAPRAPSQIRVDLDPRFEQVILKALHKQPAERYTSAREIIGDLESRDEIFQFETLNLNREAAAQVRKRRSEIRRFRESRVDNPIAPPPEPPHTSPYLIGGLIVLVIIVFAVVLALLLL